jgi:peptidoglycan/LPS O-acetylase OafA/YrhL
LKFRTDINGLRAIAVIAVVLFHFNPNWVPGGFAGVDVFFVISGFLMTSIIFRGLEENTFNLFKFYVSRANRIIPALAVLCFVLLVFGWFYLTPSGYQILGKHAATSMGFFSNVFYWRESGYFDGASHEKWLLHTWSLSVEWQFYIIYPAVLIILKKFISIQKLKILLVLVTIVGFSGCVYATIRWPDPAYYLLPTRAWEMMLGGLAYLYPIALKNSQKKSIELLGIGMILFSYAFISSDTPWPGYLAIFPVLGAYLVLISNRQNSLITNNTIFQILGKWSYSIYLWHWPLVVFGYNFFDPPNWWLYGIPLSIVLGFISYKFIENYRFPSFESWFQIFKVKPIWSAVGVIIFSLFIFTLDGFNVPYRSAANTESAKLIDKYKNYNMDPSGLFLKCNASLQMKNNGVAHVDDECLNDTKNGLFLWGDSHMGSLSVGLRENLPKNMAFSQLTSSGCAPSFKIKRNGHDRFDVGCDYSNGIAYDSILKTRPNIVILGAQGQHTKNDWLKTVSILKELNVKKIIILGPFLQWLPSLPSIYAKRHLGEYFIHDMALDKNTIANNAYMKKLAKANTDFYFIDIFASLCKGDNHNLSCRARVENELITFDYGHLTLEGTNFIVKEYILDLL